MSVLVTTLSELVTMSVLVTTSVVETRTVAETLSVSKWSGVRAGAEQRPAKQLIRQQYEEVLVFPGIVFNIGQQSDASGLRVTFNFSLLMELSVTLLVMGTRSTGQPST